MSIRLSKQSDDSIFLSQIFYPRDLFSSFLSSDAYLIGWNLDNFRCFVAFAISIIPSSDIDMLSENIGSKDSLYEKIELALKYTIEELHDSLEYCSSNHPIILGKWKHQVAENYIPSYSEQSSSIWITITPDQGQVDRKPMLHSVYSLGSIYYTSSYMIEYVTINSDQMECMRLEPSIDTTSSNLSHSISSSMVWKGLNERTIGSSSTSVLSNNITNSNNCNSNIISNSNNNNNNNNSNSNNNNNNNSSSSNNISNNSNSINNSSCSRVGNIIADIGIVLRHINTSYDLHHVFIHYLQIISSNINVDHGLDVNHVDKVEPINQQSLIEYLSVDFSSNHPYDSDNSRNSSNSTSYSSINDNYSTSNEKIPSKVNLPILTSCLLFSGYILDTFTNILLTNLESKHFFSWWSIGQMLANWVGLRGNDGIGNDPYMLGVSLYELSLSAVHVREKFQNYKIMIYQSIMFMKSWSKPSSIRSVIYRDLLRIVIFLWIDSMIGILVGYYIYKHERTIGKYISLLYKFMESQYLKDAIKWFNHNPGGVKLNSVITRRIGTALNYIIRIFEYLTTTRLQFLHRPILLLIACIGSVGFTIQTMVVIDIIRLATLHISTLHRCFGYQHKYQLEIISSLYYLFYGKKKNILRKRIDTCEYDSHQLLFGIALFAMVIFLFPTFAAYFYLFAILDLMIVLGNYVLWIFIVFLKEFPYDSLYEVLSCYIIIPITIISCKWVGLSYSSLIGMNCNTDGIQFDLVRVKTDATNDNQASVKTLTKKLTNQVNKNVKNDDNLDDQHLSYHHSNSYSKLLKIKNLSIPEPLPSALKKSKPNNITKSLTMVDTAQETLLSSSPSSSVAAATAVYKNNTSRRISIREDMNEPYDMIGNSEIDLKISKNTTVRTLSSSSTTTERLRIKEDRLQNERYKDYNVNKNESKTIQSIDEVNDPITVVSDLDAPDIDNTSLSPGSRDSDDDDNEYSDSEQHKDNIFQPSTDGLSNRYVTNKDENLENNESYEPILTSSSIDSSDNTHRLSNSSENSDNNDNNNSTTSLISNPIHISGSNSGLLSSLSGSLLKSNMLFAQSFHSPVSSLLLLSSSASTSLSASTKTKTMKSSGSTIYLKLSPKFYSIVQFYLPYSRYWQYFIREKGLIWRLLKGMIHGRPSLDIQLILATTDLSTISRRPVDYKCDYFIRKSSISSSSSSPPSSPKNKERIKSNILSKDKSSLSDDVVGLDDLITIDYYRTLNYVLSDSFSSSSSISSSDKFLKESAQAQSIPIRPRGLTEYQYKRNRILFHLVLCTCFISLMVMMMASMLFITTIVYPNIGDLYDSYLVTFETLQSITINHRNNISATNISILSSTTRLTRGKEWV